MCLHNMLDQDGDVIMLRVSPFTIISGGATGVDSKAETLAKHHGLPVHVLVPPCHPRSKTIHPLLILSYKKLIRGYVKLNLRWTGG